MGQTQVFLHEFSLQVKEYLLVKLSFNKRSSHLFVLYSGTIAFFSMSMTYILNIFLPQKQEKPLPVHFQLSYFFPNYIFSLQRHDVLT